MAQHRNGRIATIDCLILKIAAFVVTLVAKRSVSCVPCECAYIIRIKNKSKFCFGPAKILHTKLKSKK